MPPGACGVGGSRFAIRASRSHLLSISAKTKSRRSRVERVRQSVAGAVSGAAIGDSFASTLLASVLAHQA